MNSKPCTCKDCQNFEANLEAALARMIAAKATFKVGAK